jgi:hypothetical protein
MSGIDVPGRPQNHEGDGRMRILRDATLRPSREISAFNLRAMNCPDNHVKRMVSPRSRLSLRIRDAGIVIRLRSSILVSRPIYLRRLPTVRFGTVGIATLRRTVVILLAGRVFNFSLALFSCTMPGKSGRAKYKTFMCRT